MKKFYGVRFLGGNRTCTTGKPNPITGRMSIACDIQVFRSKKELEEWVNARSNDGERISATKYDCRKFRRGDSMKVFEMMLELAESSRYE